MIDFPDSGTKVISWLPAAHIAERGAHYYLPIVRGVSVTICSDPREIVEFLPEGAPDLVLRGAADLGEAEGGVGGDAARAFLTSSASQRRRGSRRRSRRCGPSRPARRCPSEVAEAAREAEEQMFSKLRATAGPRRGAGRERRRRADAARGARVLPRDRHPGGGALGHVGDLRHGDHQPAGADQARHRRPTGAAASRFSLDGDGEVLVKGDSVMPGYRNMPEKNAETIDRRRLASTGDIGEIDEDGYLKIVDRKKELIINAAGKNMSPANIEAHLKAASPLMGQVVSDRRCPALQHRAGRARSGLRTGLGGPERAGGQVDRGARVRGGPSRRRSRRASMMRTRRCPGWSRSRSSRSCRPSGSQAGDELTPTMKLKRKPIDEKYAEEIEALYSG